MTLLLVPGRYFIRDSLSGLLSVLCLMMVFFTPALADSGFEDPNDPALFIPSQKSNSSWLDAVGPGQGPVRRNSAKADAHDPHHLLHAPVGNQRGLDAH
mgnify:CR=1 FL=1